MPHPTATYVVEHGDILQLWRLWAYINAKLTRVVSILQTTPMSAASRGRSPGINRHVALVCHTCSSTHLHRGLWSWPRSLSATVYLRHWLTGCITLAIPQRISSCVNYSTRSIPYGGHQRPFDACPGIMMCVCGNSCISTFPTLHSS